MIVSHIFHGLTNNFFSHRHLHFLFQRFLESSWSFTCSNRNRHTRLFLTVYFKLINPDRFTIGRYQTNLESEQLRMKGELKLIQPILRAFRIRQVRPIGIIPVLNLKILHRPESRCFSFLLLCLFGIRNSCIDNNPVYIIISLEINIQCMGWTRTFTTHPGRFTRNDSIRHIGCRKLFLLR